MTFKERLENPGQVKLGHSYINDRLGCLVLDSSRPLQSRIVTADKIVDCYVESDSKDRTYPGDLWHLLEKQPTGEEEGELLVNGNYNFFQVWDSRNYTQVVRLEFIGFSWLISAFPAKDRCLIPTGSKLFFSL